MGNKKKTTTKKGADTASVEGEQLEEEARPVSPKKPASRTGEKEVEDTSESLVNEKSDIVAKKSGKIATKADDDRATTGVKSTAAVTEVGTKAEEVKSAVIQASDADDEGEIVVEKKRSKSRSASRTRTARSVGEEEEESER